MLISEENYTVNCHTLCLDKVKNPTFIKRWLFFFFFNSLLTPLIWKYVKFSVLIRHDTVYLLAGFILYLFIKIEFSIVFSYIY